MRASLSAAFFLALGCVQDNPDFIAADACVGVEDEDNSSFASATRLPEAEPDTFHTVVTSLSSGDKVDAFRVPISGIPPELPRSVGAVVEPSTALVCAGAECRAGATRLEPCAASATREMLDGVDICCDTGSIDIRYSCELQGQERELLFLLEGQQPDSAGCTPYRLDYAL